MSPSPLPSPSRLEHLVLDWLSQVPTPTSGLTNQLDDLKSGSPSNLGRPNRRSLHGTCADPPPLILRVRKRRVSSSLHDLISPPLTASDTHRRDEMQRTPSPKKRRVDTGNQDPEMTPRPVQQTASQAPVIFPGSSFSRASTSDVSSQHSGTETSSLRKKMTALAVDPEGMVRRPLRRGAAGMPKELAELYDALCDCNMGMGVISRAQEDSIAAMVGRNPKLRPLPAFVFADPAQRDALGVTPTIEQVLAVLSWADYSEEVRAQEAAWNSDVHSTLLKLAVHGGYHRQEQLVDVVNCTTGGIIKEYLAPPLLPKKVDFCIVVDPRGTENTLADQIDFKRRTCPLSSINHTDLDSLMSRPIVVSVETKRDGGSLDQAQLQVGTWQTAQWSLLSKLVPPIEPGDDSVDLLATLPFLPAVIIQGHDWSLAATTREGTKKVLWYDCPFGHTRDVLGIYKIVYGIQKFVAFSTEVFWPWYKHAVLAVEE